MSNVNIKKILKWIEYKIDIIEFMYNEDVNKIIIGSELFHRIRSYFSSLDYLQYLQYVDDKENEKRHELYGIPVIIDYNNPWNVEVCVCFKIDIEE